MKKDFTDQTEALKVLFTFNGNQITTFFTLGEMSKFTPPATVKYHAVKMGLIDTQFLCRIEGIRAWMQVGRECFFIRGGWLEFLHKVSKEKRELVELVNDWRHSYHGF